MASLQSKLETALFLENRPIEAKRLAEVLNGSQRMCDKAVKTLNERFRRGGFIYRVILKGSSYKMVIDPDFQDPILDHYSKKKKKLSKAMLETLAIIAYKQPVTKIEVDNIRGVNSANYIRALLEDEFVQSAGKKNVVGKPNMYKTTNRFLFHFGLSTLKDLPTVEEIKTYDFLKEDEFENPDDSKGKNTQK